MQGITAYTVNAFTADGGGGNAAGVVLDADSLDDQQMLTVAQTMGFSETAFVCSSKVADRRVRFFTITEEVDLCGHATIATWSLMRQKGLISPGNYKQETLAGVLDVDVDKSGIVYMQQTEPEFLDEITADKVATILNISLDDLDPNLTPRIVSTGLKDLFVALKDEQILDKMRPDLGAMTEFTTAQDIVGMHVFAMKNSRTGSLAAARNFAPRVGIDEESATGTSNGALLCYLKAQNVLPKAASYRIEQGQAMGHLSFIYGKFSDGRVWIGGETKLVGRRVLEV